MNMRSTERYGVGQSGCLAGHREDEPMLERTIEARNRAYPKGLDEHVLEWGDDERWTGCGGGQWCPTPEPVTEKSEESPDDTVEPTPCGR
jgi:hypothetical protein